MGWTKSKKLFAILNQTTEGKKIIMDAPDYEQSELDKIIDLYFKKDTHKKDFKNKKIEEEKEKENPKTLGKKEKETTPLQKEIAKTLKKLGAK